MNNDVKLASRMPYSVSWIFPQQGRLGKERNIELRSCHSTRLVSSRQQMG